MLQSFFIWGLRLSRSPQLVFGLLFSLFILAAIWAIVAVNFVISASMGEILSVDWVFAACLLLAVLLAIC
jgi:hypothetical protein